MLPYHEPLMYFLRLSEIPTELIQPICAIKMLSFNVFQGDEEIETAE